MTKQALLIVDVQNDFLPGGALGVPCGDEIVPVINRLQDRFDLVVGTQDWHPPHHGSFATNYPGRKIFDTIILAGLPQVLWPDHCVQGTTGADFAPGLRTDRFAKIFHKGVDPEVDSYSAFYDNAYRHATGLGEFLKRESVTQLYIAGLATDYCVKASALDACQREGIDTVVVADACRGVNLSPKDVENALRILRLAGVRIIDSKEIT